MRLPLNETTGRQRPFPTNGQGGNQMVMLARVLRGWPESGTGARSRNKTFRFERSERSLTSAIRKLWRGCGGVLASAGIAAFSATTEATNLLNVQIPGTRITAESYDLHRLMMYGALLIICVVFGVMFHSAYTHRKAVGHKAGQFVQNATAEIVWTVIPLIILLGTAWPAARTLAGFKDTSNADITIKATGLEWKWGYDYLKGDGEGISFFSNLYAPRKLALDSTAVNTADYSLDVDNPVVVPVNKKIRMVLTASDAIHSWHIPALGVKQDAIPGLARDTWFNAQKIGTYRGLCSIEACGAGRACLLIVVKVVSDGDYKKWVEGKKEDMAANADDPGKIRTAGVFTQRGGKTYAPN